MSRTCFAFAFLCLATVWADEAAKSFVQVTLERLEGAANDWRPVDPRTVLQPKDKVRFRFSTNFPGYLYVFNRASDGSSGQLFPPDEATAGNRVEPGQAYLLPSQGNYLIDGPPGYDITHWIVSAEPLSALPSGSTMPQSEISSSLIPRCREGGLRPRGAGGCLDDRAGPQPAKDTLLKARNIRIDKGTDARISAPAAKSGPIIYEFRVAHQ